ncbi:IclR family transcriptional regulator [Pseudonocardia alaniniphila]|uniref:IclR family transcriptional regulator n=1 Tax=Pseudonocardia alaniniphila TaxID=75291 RepID=A0ABS9T9Z0_9PSEU|nr:IclR family transcriptional regulator [Pseudonocardia alaniniphila]MCH6165111.1 IclR family transcriptional regulator [Pseudonocardia alaniniphila]
MKNKPTYSIDSVDHALRLAGLLQQEGPLRVADAAERLGVARSTAHRLLAMLVYRDFAEQNADRRYVAGSVLRHLPGVEPIAQLRSIALPHLQRLVDQTGETANLMVLLGKYVRFVATIECSHILRVGDREGRMVPAYLASGGPALLARRSDAEIDALYADDREIDLAALRRTLRQTRKQGFSINDQATEAGMTAIGHAINGPSRPAIAALSLAMPTVRYARPRLPEWVAALRGTVRKIEQDLDTTDGWGHPTTPTQA